MWKEKRCRLCGRNVRLVWRGQLLSARERTPGRTRCLQACVCEKVTVSEHPLPCEMENSVASATLRLNRKWWWWYGHIVHVCIYILSEIKLYYYYTYNCKIWPTSTVSRDRFLREVAFSFDDPARVWSEDVDGGPFDPYEWYYVINYSHLFKCGNSISSYLADDVTTIVSSVSGWRRIMGRSKLQRRYYDPKRVGSYGGVAALRRVVPEQDVERWLSEQDTYTLHKPVRRHFKRSHEVICSLCTGDSTNNLGRESNPRTRQWCFSITITCVPFCSGETMHYQDRQHALCSTCLKEKIIMQTISPKHHIHVFM